MEDMQTGKEKILVVDDLYAHRTLIVQYLEDAGYQVNSCVTPEDVGDQILECKVVVMDVHYGRERPLAGLDYIVEEIQNGRINPDRTNIIFKSIWGRDRPELAERLQRVGKFEWLDAREGLELTELREILKRSEAS